MSPRDLRKKHPKFIYESFAYSLRKDAFRMEFKFKLEPNIYFSPAVVIRGTPSSRIKKLPKKVLDNFVFHIGLAELPSYWKCATSPLIEIKAAHLNTYQLRWWKKLLLNGLAEFFYVNRIDPETMPFRIVSTNENKLGISTISPGRNVNRKYLIPVGGGKDSLVAIKLAKTMRKKIGTMVLGNVKASHNLIKACTLKPPVAIQRTIDETLLRLNTKGYLNGHTPFSSYLAFLSVFCAEIFDYGTVAAGNERSANEATLLSGDEKINPHTKRGAASSASIKTPRYGVGVNHQYSKSYEFEKDFRGYIKKYLTKEINYFSVLRPLYEIQIAKLAVQFPTELNVIRSCNLELKENSWCGKCPKCFNVFLLLYPFSDTDSLQQLFGKNLFEDQTLWKFVPELTGLKNKKPFECVATRRENVAALVLAYEKCKKDGKEAPYILRRFHETIEPQIRISKKTIDHIMHSWDDKNFLPPPLASRIYRKMMRATDDSSKNLLKD